MKNKQEKQQQTRKTKKSQAKTTNNNNIRKTSFPKISQQFPKHLPKNSQQSIPY